jgi:5-methylcytosine-specific restriction protein B
MTMSDEIPRFQIRLPKGGPLAYGRLLDERGSTGSRKFVLQAGSPARNVPVPSLEVRIPSSFKFRAKLIENGLLVPSSTVPEHLEATEDIVCNAPTQAAEVVLGRSSNGWTEWKTADGRQLGDFMDGARSGQAKAWLVRGSNVSGHNLVPRLWLPHNLVSLPAAHLRPGIDPTSTKDTLRTLIEEDYESTATYNQKQELVNDVTAFLTKMKPGDVLATISDGGLYLGQITGAPDQIASEDGRSNLRRPAEWQDASFPFENLPEELRQRLSGQHDVVDLTSVIDLLNTLGKSDEELAEEDIEDPTVEVPALARRELELPDPDQSLADELLVERSWLQYVRDLLADERQLVFYGPPGTGKTYLAQAIAEFLGGGVEQAKLIQFHPSYSYEDFFEGFRPREDPATGQVAFRLTAGPLRELADRASREGNRHVPHFLIIDELNRANLAKVFGELYFLLEYRNKSVRLTYSAEDFALPPNVFVIGTMNTADRSIALVDAAMRRRFAFVELSPNTEPTKGLLRRWLEAKSRDLEPALLLDALNARIQDPDFKIGPSYLMKPGVYRDGGLERTWTTKILPLLEEHHYGKGVDVTRTYGLAALRRIIARSAAAADTGSADTPADPSQNT